MLSIVKQPVHNCVCDACGHAWKSLVLPAACQNRACKSKAWNGARKIGRPVKMDKGVPTVHVGKRPHGLEHYDEE